MPKGPLDEEMRALLGVGDGYESFSTALGNEEAPIEEDMRGGLQGWAKGLLKAANTWKGKLKGDAESLAQIAAVEKAAQAILNG